MYKCIFSKELCPFTKHNPNPVHFVKKFIVTITIQRPLSVSLYNEICHRPQDICGRSAFQLHLVRLSFSRTPVRGPLSADPFNNGAPRARPPRPPPYDKHTQWDVLLYTTLLFFVVDLGSFYSNSIGWLDFIQKVPLQCIYVLC